MLCNKCYGMLSEKEFYKKLADFIKLKRKNLKLTNEKISELTNIDLSKVSLLQNNKQGCSAYTLYKLLYSLNINIFADNDGDINGMNNVDFYKDLFKEFRPLYEDIILNYNVADYTDENGRVIPCKDFGNLSHPIKLEKVEI